MTITIIFRSLIIYLIILMLLRLMGKRQIGEMQPFELVITLILADLAVIPIAATEIPLFHGIIPLITLTILHFVISLITRKSMLARKLVNGKPVIIITPNGVDYKALKSLNMSFNDLLENLRIDGHFYIDQIMYAIVQTNGSLSVLTKSQHSPPTALDMKVEVDKAALPLIVVSEGKLQAENMHLAGIEQNFLTKNIKKLKLNSLKDILLLTLSQNGEMYIQPKKGEYKVIKTNYNGDGVW